MKKREKHHRLLSAVLGVLFSLLLSVQVFADTDSYMYTIWKDAVPAPNAYTWSRSVRAEDLGIDAINGISDMFYRNHRLYIAMSGRIVVTDEEFQTLKVIDSYEKDGATVTVASPQSIFVTEDDQIYFTEEAKGLIIQLDEKYQFVRALGDPHITTLEGITYAPSKVAVDSVGRIYVKAKSVYEGIIELNPEGVFTRFVGAVEVSPSILEIFYRAIASEEQISRMALWLPTDYSDIAIDSDGFLMATVKDSSSQEPVRRLNSDGTDIMREYDQISRPKGDLKVSSTLTCIATSEDGRFAVLDSAFSRVFVYSNSGILAYVIGGSSSTDGGLASPVDVAFMGDQILVADLVACSVEVFDPTDYGLLINNGLNQESIYDYAGAANYYTQAYEIDPNCLVASMGLGKYELRNGDYKAAMRYFRQAGERDSYSQAYEFVREDFLNRNMGKILVGILLFILAVIILKKLITALGRKFHWADTRFGKLFLNFRYTVFQWPAYMMSHPFKAFDEVKYEKAGSIPFCFVILVLFSWISLVRYQYFGFVGNYNNVAHVNVPLILSSSILLYLVFIVGNWAVGTLIDGKGSMAEIFKVNMYALYPSLYLVLIGVLISRVALVGEVAFASIFIVAPVVLYVFYTFVGLIMVHQFSFTKALVSILLSFIAMAILLFLAILLLTLVSGVINDVMTIVDEVTLYL